MEQFQQPQNPVSAPSNTPDNATIAASLVLEQTVRQLIIEQLQSAELWRLGQTLDSAQDFLAMGLEQLDLFEVVIKLEDTFKVEISDEDGLQLTCVNHIVDYLQERDVSGV